MRVQDKSLEVALAMLKHAGQDPRRFELKEKLWTVFWLVHAVISTIFCAVGLYFIKGSSGIMIAKKVEGMMTQFHVFSRLYSLMVFKYHLKAMLEDRKRFWNINDFGNDISQELNSMFNKLLKFFIFFRGSTYFTSVLNVITPILMQDHSLPFGSYVFEGFPYSYEAMYASQSFYYIVVVEEVLGFDCLFATLCLEVVVQFKLLNYKLSCLKIQKGTMDSSQYLSDLKTCIDYHNFLLGYSSGVRYYCQTYLLCQYNITIASICMELYLLSENIDDPPQVLRCTLFVLCLLIQWAFYCFLAEALKEKAFKVAVSVYESGWTDDFVKEGRTAIKLIIMRANIPVALTAGKMLIVDRQLFVFVVRTAMSFFTLLRTLKARE
ncbi:Odorant receptor Or66 [Rhyzopertha dominica]|nr:Odorant receptor Or66 [Rhyzopertha dominica]